MERSKTITPAQFVEKWLPDFSSRLIEYMHAPYDAKTEPPTPYEFTRANFPEALAAFEAHIREKTWREACEAQRISCHDAYLNADYSDIEYDGMETSIACGAIRNAPIPEIPKNEKI